MRLGRGRFYSLSEIACIKQVLTTSAIADQELYCGVADRIHEAVLDYDDTLAYSIGEKNGIQVWQHFGITPTATARKGYIIPDVHFDVMKYALRVVRRRMADDVPFKKKLALLGILQRDVVEAIGLMADCRHRVPVAYIRGASK